MRDNDRVLLFAGKSSRGAGKSSRGAGTSGRGARRSGRAPVAAVAALLVLGGCVSAGQQANTATGPTAVPGSVQPQGQGTIGSISVTVTSIVRTGSELSITGRVHNSGRADQLVGAGSQVSPDLTLSPPLPIPAGATVQLGEGGTKLVLTQQLRLEPGGTVALTLRFRDAGSVQAFSGFTG